MDRPSDIASLSGSVSLNNETAHSITFEYNGSQSGFGLEVCLNRTRIYDVPYGWGIIPSWINERIRTVLEGLHNRRDIHQIMLEINQNDRSRR